MGEVYRARDVRLGRNVAIKILPAAFTGDPDRLARFEREARVLASLNHPNIAAIYGFEEAPISSGAGDTRSTRALVLELVEGETLAGRIERAAVDRTLAGTKTFGLPVAEALNLARQIADALDAAHDKGIVHRDLKPGNVMITPDGVVKVLDFGLAKAGDAGSAMDVTHSPTVTVEGTRGGVLLGTAAYMSPEQARGQVVDKRTDIWAFGCVLYEKLTGKRAFRGETVADVFAAVLEREPDWQALPDDTPHNVRRVLRQCLERDRRRRRRDIGDVLVDLTATSQPEQPATPVSSRRALRPAAVAAVVAALAGAIAGALLLRPSSPASDEPDELLSLTRVTSDDGFTADPAISRDGALVAYASDRAGEGQLDIWVQQTAGGTPIRVTRDSFDEREPSFSPDGSRIAFRSERDGGGVYVVPAFGSEAPRFLAAAGRRPRFSPDGQMIAYWTGSNIGFGARPDSYRIYVVPVSGGAPREVAPQMTALRFPVWSPDGKALLVLGSDAPTPAAETYDWWVIPIDGSAAKATGALTHIRRVRLEPRDADLNNLAGGAGPDDWTGSRVLYSDLDYLWSITLDPVSHQVTGPPRRLTFGTNHDAQAASSASGAVVFSSASFVNTVFGLSLDPASGAVTGTPARMTGGITYDARPSSSADGRLIAYRSSTSETTAIVKDLTDNRLIDLGVRPSNFGPAISPDGRWVAFESSGGVDIVPSQGGPSRMLCRDCTIGDWTEDSGGIAVVADDRLSFIDAASATSTDLIAGEGLNRPFLSPDRRLIVFRAPEDELSRMYVAQVDPRGPVSRDRWMPLGSAEADVRPSGWSNDGRLLYIVSSRDGARCLYGFRIDRETGRPQGEAFALRHFHGSRNAWAGTTGVLSTGPASAVRGGRFLYDLATFSANVWLMTPAVADGDRGAER
jgi:serine/threonine protein kinase